MQFAKFAVRAAAIIIVYPVGQIAVLLNFEYQTPRAYGVYRSRRNKITIAFFYRDEIKQIFHFSAREALQKFFLIRIAFKAAVYARAFFRIDYIPGFGFTV